MSATQERCPPVGIRWHPLAEIFPWMDDTAAAELREDIKKNGVLEPIVFLDGQILDGRNRYMAARDLGVDYPRVEYEGDDPLAFVIAKNLARRHLTESQRAMVASRLAKMPKGRPTENGEISPLTQSQAAEQLSVSRDSVKHARKVQERGAPELVEAVDRGDVSVSAAAEVATLPAEEQSGVVALGEKEIVAKANKIKARRRAEKRAKAEKSASTAAPVAGRKVDDLSTLIKRGERFGCIYADPPWVYDNQGTRAATGNHYDGLTVEQLCEMPVRDLVADDAHLHLWTTNGFLFECPKIFEAWGFEFRSSFIWVKPQMGIGNYWRNSHEFLLTAVRGDAKRFNDKSIMSWLECDRGKHSAKPERVRSFLERASSGPYLELFARTGAENWTVFGNQLPDTLLCADMERVA